jgi:transposase
LASTIQDNLRRAEEAGLGWPLPPDMTDAVLEERLFSKMRHRPSRRRRTEPDWTALAREMKRPGVNLMILWEEYRTAHPDGYGYSRFCDLFREFERRMSPVMRQHHVAGDKLFVDYSGKKIAIADPATGELRDAEIFVGVLGASNYTYAEATFTQSLPDWLGAHVRMFRFLWRRSVVDPAGLCARAHNRPYVPLTDMWPNIVWTNVLADLRARPAT